MTRNNELAARYGTPLYIYDLDRVTAAHRDLRNSLPAGMTIFYSLKANPHPEVARALRETGTQPCRAELSSLGELDAALAAGFAAEQCLYTGPGKTEDELAVAIGLGVRTFSIESLGDLKRAGAVACRADTIIDCLLRINSAVSSSATSIRMMGARSQFGIDSETLEALLPEFLAVPGTRVVGVHLFSQSNARDEESLIGELRQSIVNAAMLHAELDLPMRFLDIGGGFGAPYAVPGSRPVYTRLRQELEDALDANFPRWRSGIPEIACESGRYLVGDCGELMTSVTNVKESRGQTFAILDAGVNTLGGMAGLGRLLPIAVGVDDADASPDAQSVTLVGPLCTPGDVLCRNAQLASVEPGRVLGVPNVGAYGLTASLLHFLSRPAPYEVVVRGGEIVSVSRIEARRQQWDEGHLSLNAIPEPVHCMDLGVPG
jgi:diaminopimelate decarboxylase